MTNRSRFAAYGGPGWSPREKSLSQEIGTVWEQCGIDSEWEPLKSVLLHQPGPEITDIADPDDVQMLEIPDFELVTQQHKAMADAYRSAGVAVHYVAPNETPPPNLMFIADLMFMTPEGVILSRPASDVRAGEERIVARSLASLGIPILRSIRGVGTFEGADAAWIDPDTVMIGIGFRTNRDGASQIRRILDEMGKETIMIELPQGSMHLMGDLRFVDSDLAMGRSGRTTEAAIHELRERGFNILFPPDEAEISHGMSLNFVTLGRKRILMAADNPKTRSFYEDAGINCHIVRIDELAKAAGGIGCLSGILERKVIK